MKYLLRRFRKHEDGGALVEAVLVIGVLVLTLAAFVEFTMLMHWWNQGAKAVQLGSRMASVSDPVDSSLLIVANSDPTMDFGERVCTVIVPEGTRSPSDLPMGTCEGGIYNRDAMKRIIFGTDEVCSTTSDAYHGMCDVFPAIASQGGQVEVRYMFGGLGYVNRLGGPVPVISVTLRDVPFPLPILDRMLSLAGMTMPDRSSTAVGEDLSATFASGG